MYEFRRKGRGRQARWSRATPQHFVVNFDRGESDLTPLTDEQKESLSKDGRMTFVETVDELVEQTFTDTGRTEVWRFLLLAFVGLLCLEVWMTRRLVQGGHMDIDDLPDEDGEATVDEIYAEMEEER